MPRSKHDAPILDEARRQAEARVKALAQEIESLFVTFPDLRNSFDPDELPIPFLLATGAGQVKREAKRGGRKTRAKK